MMTLQEYENIFKDEYTKDVRYITRFAKNGQKYVWEIQKLTTKQALKIINKYGAEQISDTTIWLNY